MGVDAAEVGENEGVCYQFCIFGADAGTGEEGGREGMAGRGGDDEEVEVGSHCVSTMLKNRVVEGCFEEYRSHASSGEYEELKQGP